MSDITDARIVKYQCEVLINRKASDIWHMLTNDINAWWMDDFRALGENSEITLDAVAGGQLAERTNDNSTLEWYRVQMVIPEKPLFLVGYLAPDWGGPTTSMLKLAIEDRDSGCALIVSDALLGNVTEASAANAQAGWNTLFGEGLKYFAEKQD